MVSATEFKHIGDYVLQSHCKLTGAEMRKIPTKPLTFQVYTDGIHVQVRAEGNEEACSTFKIYCSAGIGRQRQESGALEVIPGIQALSNSNGTVRQLRLTRESFTITTFPGVSDQTSVSYSVAAVPNPGPTTPPLDAPTLPPKAVAVSPP
jgi:hypothetical protein